jgi:multidrug efflux system outer membrane protein
MRRVRGWWAGVVAGSMLLGASPLSGQDPARGAFWEAVEDTVLTRLLDQARTESQEVLAAEARVEGAEASRLHSSLGLAPIVTADAGYTRRRFATSSFPGDGVGALPDENVWESRLRASWEVDVFGRVRGEVHAQSALTDVAEEDVRDRRIGVAADVARTYFELRGVQEQLTVARRNAENQEQTLAITRARLESGRGTELDVERARAQLNSTLATVPTLEARVATAEYRLAVVVGRPPGELTLGDARPLPELPETVPAVRDDDIVVDRPDVVAAEGLVEARRALVGSAKADYWPRLSLTAGAGYTAHAVDAFGNTGTFSYAVGPVLSWAAFDLGRVKARVDAARAREREARMDLERARLAAREEVEAASVRYRSSRTELEHLEEAARASERAAALARLRYEGGVADFLQVLDAERTLLAAQDRLVRARAAAAAAYVGLFEARGGVWER